MPLARRIAEVASWIEVLAVSYTHLDVYKRQDLQGRAIALKDGKPIEGLYVVGEASGGLHGQERMTGCSMPECAVFGMIAGESAAQRKSI